MIGPSYWTLGVWPQRSASWPRKVATWLFFVCFVWRNCTASRCHTLSAGITVSTLALWRKVSSKGSVRLILVRLQAGPVFSSQLKISGHRCLKLRFLRSLKLWNHIHVWVNRPEPDSNTTSSMSAGPAASCQEPVWGRDPEHHGKKEVASDDFKLFCRAAIDAACHI